MAKEITNDDLAVIINKGFQDMEDRFQGLETNMNERFETVDKRFEAVDQRFLQIEQKIDAIDMRIANLAPLFEVLDLKKRLEIIEKKLNIENTGYKSMH